VDGTAYAKFSLNVDRYNKHEFEAALRDFLINAEADEYVISYPAWGLPGPFPELPANFEDHPQRTEHVLVVAGNSSYTLQAVLNVVKDPQDRIAELTGDGIGKYTGHGLFHGLLEPARPVTIN
jgi:hypothetical protein